MGTSHHHSKKDNLSLYRSSRTANSRSCPNRPLLLLVETTSRCNLSCRMCNVHHDDRSGIAIDESLLEMTFPLAETALSVGPYGLGEPLLHPRIAEIIRKYKSSRCTVSLTTNGMLMSKKISEGLISSGLDHLAISVDAAEPVLLSRIRKGADLKRITDNITKLNRLKKSLQSPNPSVSLNVVVQAANFHQLPDILRLAELLEVPCVTFSPITIHKHIAEIQNESLGPEFAAARKIIERCYREAESRGISIDTQRLHYVLNGSNWETVYRETIPCPEPFRFMAIRANGDIFPCCNWDVNKPIARISSRLKGDSPRSPHTAVSDLETAWNHMEWELLRERIVSNDYPAECKVCMSNFTRPLHDDNFGE